MSINEILDGSDMAKAINAVKGYIAAKKTTRGIGFLSNAQLTWESFHDAASTRYLLRQAVSEANRG